MTYDLKRFGGLSGVPDEVPGETPRLTLSGRGSSLPHNDSWGGEVPTPVQSGPVAVPVGAGGSATAHGRGGALPEWGSSHSSGRAGKFRPSGVAGRFPPPERSTQFEESSTRSATPRSPGVTGRRRAHRTLVRISPLSPKNTPRHTIRLVVAPA